MTITLLNNKRQSKSYLDCLATYRDKKYFRIGRYTLLAGRSGEGKTTTAIQLCVQFALGKDFYNITPLKETPCIYVNAEQNKDSVSKYFEGLYEELKQVGNKQALKTLKRNLEIYTWEEYQKSGDKDVEKLDWIEKAIVEFRTARGLKPEEKMLMVLDSAMSCFDDISNTHSSRKIREKLMNLSRRMNVSFLICCHTNLRKHLKKGEFITQEHLRYRDLSNNAENILVIQKMTDEDDIETFHFIHEIKQSTGYGERLSSNGCFIADYEKLRCKYDHKVFRELKEPTSSSALGELLNMYFGIHKSKYRVAIQQLKRAGIIKKIKDRNEYISVANN